PRGIFCELDLRHPRLAAPHADQAAAELKWLDEVTHRHRAEDDWYGAIAEAIEKSQLQLGLLTAIPRSVAIAGVVSSKDAQARFAALTPPEGTTLDVTKVIVVPPLAPESLPAMSKGRGAVSLAAVDAPAAALRV